MKYPAYIVAIGVLSLAAMPLAVHAVGGSSSVSESLTIGVPASCGIYDGTTAENSATDKIYTKTLTNGAIWNSDTSSDLGSTYSIACNDVNGWALYAVGNSDEDRPIAPGYDTTSRPDRNKMLSIESNSIPAGTATSGAEGAWAFRVTTTDTALIAAASSYSQVPSTQTVVLSTSTIVGSSFSTFRTGYHVYIGTMTPSGTYTGKVSYTLVHPRTGAAPADKPLVRYMQDVAEWGDSVDIGESIQVVDKRDDKTYWVTRLKNNSEGTESKLWMTQNLDYDLSVPANQSLSPDTSDVTSDKTLTITSSWGTSDTALNYQDGGDIYYADGTAKTGTSTSGLAADSTNWHYHAGSYYSWNAATANTSSSNTNYTNASGSICPKGWRLPTAYDGSKSALGDFTRLNNAYGGTPSTEPKDAILTASPLYFPRAGDVRTGSLNGVGSYGHYWSSTVGDSSSAYELYVGSTYVSPTIGSGYQGYSARCVARGEQHTITWNANEGTVSPSTSTIESGSALGTLPTPTRDGYNFVGWFTAATGGTQVSESTTVSGDVTYYAHWQMNPFTVAFAGKEKLNGYYKMQDMTASICSSIATPTTVTEDTSIQLIDVRDNKVYWVSKLKDGNCWMTQNLDYDLSVTANKSLKAATSDVTSDKTLTITSSWNLNSTALYYLDGGDIYFADVSTSTSTSGLAADSTNWHYHAGSYYSWNAATANTHSSTTNYTNASGSICPKGWRLPTSYDGSSSAPGDFTRLNNAYGGITNSDATLRAAPLYFPRAGFVNAGSLKNVGSYGNYWSSTVSDSNFAYYLNLLSTVVDPMSSNRSFGRSVRCVAR